MVGIVPGQIQNGALVGLNGGNCARKFKTMKTKEIKQEMKIIIYNKALNHDRPHLQTPLPHRRLVLQEILVVCKGNMRS
jgi:hypothetical protein